MRSLLSRRWLVAAPALAIVALALVFPAFALAGAPVLILAFTLAAGCFPGEDAIARLRDRATRSNRLSDAPLVVRAVLRATPRDSRLLICFSLANRPPPLALHA